MLNPLYVLNIPKNLTHVCLIIKMSIESRFIRDALLHDVLEGTFHHIAIVTLLRQHLVLVRKVLDYIEMGVQCHHPAVDHYKHEDVEDLISIYDRPLDIEGV